MDYYQTNLFDDQNENESLKNVTPVQPTEQIIKIQSKRILSKHELNFNKLSSKLEKTQNNYTKSLENETFIRKYYNENIVTLENEINELEKQLVIFIFNRFIELNPIKFSEKDREKTEILILNMAKKFRYELTKEGSLNKIFEYFDNKFGSEEINQEDFEKDDLDDDMGEEDFMDNGDDEYTNQKLNKDFEKFIKNFKIEDYIHNERFKEAAQRGPKAVNDLLTEIFLEQALGFDKLGFKPRKPRKKSQKQLDREQEKILREQEKENLRNKSLKSIYIGLAKLLHPDRHLEEEEKLKNEELMKKVTVAYNNKDVFTLLKLEMEFIKKEEKTIENLPETTIIIYNEFLQEQIREIESNIMKIVSNLHFSNIIPSCAIYSLLNLSYLTTYLITVKNKLIKNIDKNKLRNSDYYQTKKSFQNFKTLVNTLSENLKPTF